MKVIITGGAGFIGGHAVKHFVNCGDEVLNVDKLTYAANKENLDSNFIQLDIADKLNFENLVSDFKPDFIINFAAETHVDNSILSSQEFIHSNIQGVASILSACNKFGVKLCHISTDEVYGPAENKAFTEEDRLNPMNPYSVTKASADMLIKSFYNTYKTPYLIVRPSNNYGPNQHQEKFIPKLINCLMNDSKFPLYGDGLQIREWTYVEDTVTVIRHLLHQENNWHSVYNLSSGISMTNLQAINKIIEKFNIMFNKHKTIQDVVEFVLDRKGHDRKYFISPLKLNSQIEHEYTSFGVGILNILNCKGVK